MSVHTNEKQRNRNSAANGKASTPELSGNTSAVQVFITGNPLLN
jgi:hypothetical protein